MKSRDSFYGMIGRRKGWREEQERGRLTREEFSLSILVILQFSVLFHIFLLLNKNRLGKI